MAAIQALVGVGAGPELISAALAEQGTAKLGPDEGLIRSWADLRTQPTSPSAQWAAKKLLLSADFDKKSAGYGGNTAWIARRAILELGPSIGHVVPPIWQAIRTGSCSDLVFAATVLRRAGKKAIEAEPELASAVPHGQVGAGRAFLAETLVSLEPANMARLFPALQLGLAWEEPVLSDPQSERSWVPVGVLCALSLWRSGEAGMKTVVEGLANPNVIVRRNCATALGILGSEAIAALPALKIAAQSKDKSVQQATVSAILKIQPPDNATPRVVVEDQSESASRIAALPFVLDAKVPLGGIVAGPFTLVATRFRHRDEEIQAEVEVRSTAREDQDAAVRVDLYDSGNVTVLTIQGSGEVEEGKINTLRVKERLSKLAAASIATFTVMVTPKQMR